MPETIPCKFCGQPTPMLGTQMCNGCWEVEHRLNHFLKHPAARAFVLKRVRARDRKLARDQKLEQQT